MLLELDTSGQLRGIARLPRYTDRAVAAPGEKIRGDGPEQPPSRGMGRTGVPRVLLALVLATGVAAAGPHPEPAIEIHGNRVLSADAIRAGITADQATLVDRHGDISQEAVERATLLVSALYWDRGHAQVHVGEPVIDRTNHRLEFTVEEGPKFSIGRIRVTGDLLRTERAFLAMLATGPGRVFSRTGIANDRQKLQRFYEDRGYAFANVLPLTKVDLDRKTIGLTFEITRGELAFVDKLTVTGNRQTPTAEVLDLVSIAEGAPYHGTRIEAAQQRLRGVFRAAWVVVKRGKTPASVEIEVEVDE